MTRKQIENARKELGLFQNWTEKEKKIDKELWCREMINSCLCYGTNFYKHADNYIVDLGATRVNELFIEQMNDFKKAKVIKNSYTDFEGCTYNTIIWEDEEEYGQL